MRRRDLLGAAGWLGLASVLPLTACGSSNGAPTTDPSPASPFAPTPTSGAPATTSPHPATDPVGGRLLQADIKRLTPASAASVRDKLLPVSAALYRAALPGNDNAVLSPYSIVSALGMLALGARGTTAREMAKVLGGDAATVARWLGGVDAALGRAVAASKANSSGSAAPAVLEPANAVFLGSGSGVRPAYLDALATGYAAGVREVDFADAVAATAAINDWVGQRTHGLIPQLLPQGFVDAATLLVLVNALYLKAAWVDAFSSPGAPQAFTTLAATVQVPLMTRSGVMPYASGPDWHAFSIPLEADLAMTVILPDAGAFRRVSANLDRALLAAAMSGQQRHLELSMPGFTTDVSTDLIKPLAAMGLHDLFSSPDLSGITDGASVSGAIHQARIVVDDNGIEAAAATAIAVGATGLLVTEVTVVRVDRPFLYVLHDVETRTPLFLGRVTDPTR